MRALVVTLDALFALREASGARAAEPAAAATLAMLAGCDAIQLGVGEDGRPASESDARDIARAAPLELRIAPTPSLAKVALELRPTRVVLATEAREGGCASPLDLRLAGPALTPAVRMLRDAGLRVGALIAPDSEAVKVAHAAHVEMVDLFTGTTTDLPEPSKRAALERLGDAARLASKLRLEVGIAGALGLRDLQGVLAAAPVVERVTVGRAFVARALLVGVERSVQALRERL
jgi:pyridoxine 5'-phosphate synthase PdxJ